jgi:hypothetical protein
MGARDSGAGSVLPAGAAARFKKLAREKSWQAQ